MAALPRLDNFLEGVANQENNPGGAGGFWNGGGPSEGKLGPWSTLVLDAQTFPGVSGPNDPGCCPVEISGMVKYRIDSQKVRGHDGHRMVADGYEPTQCTAIVKIYTPAQWQAFIAYLPRINPKTPRTRGKVDAKGRPVLTQPTKQVTTALPTSVLLNANGKPVTYQTTVPDGPAVQVQEAYRPSYTVEHPWLAMYGITRVYINEVTFPEEFDGRMIRAVKMTMWEVWDIKAPTGGVLRQTDSSATVNVNSDFRGAPGAGPAPGDPQDAARHEPRTVG